MAAGLVAATGRDVAPALGDRTGAEGPPGDGRSAVPGPPRVAGRRPGRDPRIDVLRGTFIVSMTAGHLAGGSAVDTWTHPLRWVDGAAGFVLLSGFVLGMAQRRAWLTHGAAAAHRRLARRAAFLYLVAVASIAAGLLFRVATGRPDFFPSVAALGGWSAALPGVATLRVQPDFLDVLPLYAVLLVAAQPLVALLRRGRSGPVVAGSLALYVASQFDPTVVPPPDIWSPGLVWSWGAWQLLFVGGLVAGWHWRERLQPWTEQHGRAMAVPAWFLLAGLVALAWTATDPRVLRAFEKYTLGPGVPVYLLTFLLAVWPVLGRVEIGRAHV